MCAQTLSAAKAISERRGRVETMTTILKRGEQWFLCSRKRIGLTTIEKTLVPVTPYEAIQIRMLGAAFEKEELCESTS
jgi:hypothetical protein